MGKGAFSGKTVFVLGGSRGIGEGIVRRFATDGARVAFTYANSADAAAAIVHEIGTADTALAIQADNGDAAAVESAIEQAISAFGRIDILVANASTLITANIPDYPLADFDRMIAVNLRGTFVAIQKIVPQMERGGRVITIGSNVAVRTMLPGYSIYTLTKGALAAFARACAIDLAPRGITVNNIQPGPTATDMIGKVPEIIDAVSAHVPLGRLGLPAEIASLVAYVASDEAGYITGASLDANGGFLA